MAGEYETLPPRPVTPPNRRIGALSGNTKGISTSADTATEAAPGQSAYADSRQPPVSQGPAVAQSGDDDADASALDISLPHVGELTSASEDAIVDPSAAVLAGIDLGSWKWPEFVALAPARMEEPSPTSRIPRGSAPGREYVTAENDFRSLA